MNVKDGQISKIMPEFEGSQRIFDIRGDFILISASTPTNSGNVYIYNCEKMEHKKINVPAINSNRTLQEVEESLEHSVIELNATCHVVLLKPKSFKKLPLIMIPHGGPNSVYSVDYVFYPVVFARLGFAVASSKQVI